MNDDEKLELMVYVDGVIKKAINEAIQSQSDSIRKKITNKVELDMRRDNIVDRLLQKDRIKELSRGVCTLIEDYLKDLEDIKSFKEDIERSIVSSIQSERNKIVEKATEDIEAHTENIKGEITASAQKAYDLVEFIENVRTRIVAETIRKIVEQIKLDDPRPREININVNGIKERTLKEGVYHKKFEDVYTLIRIGLPVMLIGPTGCGKSECASQISNILELPFYYTNNVSEEYKLLGYRDASGVFRDTQFYKAFTEGGLFFLDEMDNSHPSALLTLNSAIGSMDRHIYMSFEDGKFTEANPNFRIIAAANTWGNGATRMYCGRSELDAASLDRFTQVEFDYDRNIERFITDDEQLLTFAWNYRDVINDVGIRHAVTTRNISYADKMKKAGLPIEKIMEYVFVRELDVEDLKQIYTKFTETKLPETEYSSYIQKRILKKA